MRYSNRSTMHHILQGLFGIVFSYCIIRYREPIGAMIGDPEWAGKVGGIYNVLIIVGIFIFFWSVASLSGTTDIFFAPILMFLPHRGSLQ